MPLPMNRLIEKMVFFGFSTIFSFARIADEYFAAFIKVNDRRNELACRRGRG